MGDKIASLCFNPNARKRHSAKCDVQLRFARATSSRGSSTAADPDDGGRGAERTVPIIWENVSGLGTAVDRAGKAAAGAAVATAIFDPQRAAADGATGIQSAVPLGCGVECGRAGVGPHGVQQESRPAV